MSGDLERVTPIVAAADGVLTTTSIRIADGTDVQHKNVLELVRNNIADFEEFGGVAFETRPCDTAGLMTALVVGDRVVIHPSDPVPLAPHRVGIVICVTKRVHVRLDSGREIAVAVTDVARLTP